MHKKKSQEILLNATSATHQLPNNLQERLLITPVEAGACVGWAKQTVYNKLRNDDFPIPLLKFNGHKMVRVSDLVQYISGLKPDEKQPRRPCRPTKSDTIRREIEMKRGVA
jgi:hypothetical protein